MCICTIMFILKKPVSFHFPYSLKKNPAGTQNYNLFDVFAKPALEKIQSIISSLALLFCVSSLAVLQAWLVDSAQHLSDLTQFH